MTITWALTECTPEDPPGSHPNPSYAFLSANHRMILSSQTSDPTVVHQTPLTTDLPELSPPRIKPVLRRGGAHEMSLRVLTQNPIYLELVGER